MALYAFDGTWQDEGGETNVIKFYRAYQHNQPSPFNRYFAGVGTHVTFVGHVAGGVFGAGEEHKVDEALGALETAITVDPVIDIVGFSRGAATALDFANAIHKYLPSESIRFLGLWDTVAAFGLANLGWYFSKLTFGHHIELPPDRIAYAFHAMALDERRPSFKVTRLKGAHEVWFRGVHGDVGGGLSVGLSDIALYWMFRKAQAVGLPISGADVLGLHPKYGMPTLDRVEKYSIGPRRPELDDLVHYTVIDALLGNPRERQDAERVAQRESAASPAGA